MVRLVPSLVATALSMPVKEKRISNIIVVWDFIFKLGIHSLTAGQDVEQFGIQAEFSAKYLSWIYPQSY